MRSEELFVLLAFAVIAAFVTLGCVLLAYFWARGLGLAMRALLATGSSALVILLPIAMTGIDGDAGMFLLGGSVIILVVGYPTAFFATRKLDGQKAVASGDLASVFD